ncbi:Hydroxyacylglutathione hydrolase [Rhodovastum atsumiense]|uniref:FAD/NAD(P)-binding protein n=1 Tax=Rhodovastum atsumiense TaxID=504468 RepID=UPI00193BA00B|nr:FAD/NAD(P)-binding protein [Rhodovastum atsumiense]CAH2604737.1 Hydroxyacylglutathione hydrolase [Rhodovastum atsumiense]
MTGEAAPVAVIGAGFSGTLVALQLARHLPPHRPILLCERSGAFGPGLAYTSGHPDHLLNVRAANMSPFPEAPSHFQDWLDRQPAGEAGQRHLAAPGSFASRALYGRYLGELLEAEVAACPGRLQRIHAQVTCLRPAEGGFALDFADGSTRFATACVLAIGNLPAAGTCTPLVRYDPWATTTTTGLRPDIPVLIIGTGLTMIDLAVEIFARGVPGPVVALSRHGLLPHAHAPAPACPPIAFSDTERRSALALLTRLRAEVAAQDGNWRGVVDAIRPMTQTLWQDMPLPERTRFLRHLRTFWDIHRHRMAPSVAAMVESMRQSGFLQVLRGRVLDIAEDGELAEVSWQPRRAATSRSLIVQRVIVATGVEKAVRTSDRLLRGLLDLGVARLDVLGMGLDVTAELRLLNARGRPVDGLWALGPIVRGVFWECTAVPDIRAQAVQVARAVAETLE